MEENLYSILGIPKNATVAAIKKAYKELALKWHPDKNPDNQEEAISMFQKISNAYTILMDEKERKKYDLGINNKSKPFFRSDSSPPRSQFDDLYDRIYGNDKSKSQGNSADSTQSQHKSGIPLPPRTNSSALPNSYRSRLHSFKVEEIPDELEKEYISSFIGDCVVHVMMTLEEVFYGAIKEYSVTRYRDNVIENKTVRVKLPPGIEFGKKIVLAGQGNKCIGHEPHDIIFLVKEIQHKIYTRKDNDLHINYFVTLKEALLGFDLDIQSIDKKDFKAHVHGPIYEGYQYHVRGLGLPIEGKEGERGDLIAHIKVNFPTFLSEEDRDNIDKYFPM